LFSLQSDNNSQENSNQVSISELTLRDMARLLSVTRASDNRATHHHQPEVDDDDDEDYMDDDDEEYPSRRPMRPFFPPVTEPQKAGVELLASGEFGRVGVKSRDRRQRFNVARTVLNQGNHPVPSLNREELSSVRWSIYTFLFCSFDAIQPTMINLENGAQHKWHNSCYL